MERTDTIQVVLKSKEYEIGDIEYNHLVVNSKSVSREEMKQTVDNLKKDYSTVNYSVVVFEEDGGKLYIQPIGNTKGMDLLEAKIYLEQIEWTVNENYKTSLQSGSISNMATLLIINMDLSSLKPKNRIEIKDLIEKLMIEGDTNGLRSVVYLRGININLTDKTKTVC